MNADRVVGVAFVLVLACGIAFGVTAVRELGRNSADFWEVVQKRSNAVTAASNLHLASDRTGLLVRAYLISGDEEMRRAALWSDAEFTQQAADFRSHIDDPESLRRLTAIEAVKQEARKLGRLRHPNATEQERIRILETTEPSAQALQRQVGPAHDALDGRERELYDQAKAQALQMERAGRHLLGTMALIGLVLAFAALAFLRRTLAQLRSNRREIERVNRELVESNRDLEAFGGRVAHDLRNLLAPVGLAASSLDRAAESPEQVHTVACRLKNIVRRSNALLEDLLSFARAGQPADMNARASVAGAVRDAVEDLEPNAQAMGAHIEVDVPEATVACAPSLLHALVVNLLGNAIKFLDGRPLREVRISARTIEQSCEIEIADTGPGIPESARQKLFAPFYRVPGTQAPGTGIGLSTVSRIVEAHHGSVQVESTPGLGSIFKVSLPVPA